MSIRSAFFGTVAALTLAALAPAALAQAPAPGQAPGTAYAVKPGDLLRVSVWKEPELQQPVLVRPDGGFSFPLAGEVDARGKSVADLQKILTDRLRKYISDPVVTVAVTEVRGNKVYVIGQVNKPGEFIVNPAVDVMQALSMAGGTTAFANLGNIVVLRRTGAQQTARPFRYTEVLKGRELEQNVMLEAGDVVVVP
jgi:polysaccharide biosynthesis/export protein